MLRFGYWDGKIVPPPDFIWWASSEYTMRLFEVHVSHAVEVAQTKSGTAIEAVPRKPVRSAESKVGYGWASHHGLVTAARLVQKNRPSWLVWASGWSIWLEFQQDILLQVISKQPHGQLYC